MIGKCSIKVYMYMYVYMYVEATQVILVQQYVLKIDSTKRGFTVS